MRSDEVLINNQLSDFLYNHSGDQYGYAVRASESVSLKSMANRFAEYLSDRLSKIDPEAILYKMEDWYNNNSEHIDNVMSTIDVYESKEVEDGDI